MIVNVDHRAPLLQGANRVRWLNNLIYNWNQFAFLSTGGLNVDNYREQVRGRQLFPELGARLP
jgi:hypothetical protein